MKILHYVLWSFVGILIFIAGAGAATSYGSPLAALQAVIFFLQLLFTGRFEEAVALVVNLFLLLVSNYIGLVLLIVFLAGIGTTISFLSKAFKKS